MGVGAALGLALVAPDLLGARGDERVELVRGEDHVAVGAGGVQAEDRCTPRRRRGRPPEVTQDGLFRESPRAGDVVFSPLPGGDRQANRCGSRDRVTQLTDARSDLTLVQLVPVGLQPLAQLHLRDAGVVHDRTNEVAFHGQDQAVDLEPKLFDVDDCLPGLLELRRGVFPTEVGEVTDRRTPRLAQGARVTAAVQVRRPVGDRHARELQLVFDRRDLGDLLGDLALPPIAELGLDGHAGQAQTVLLQTADEDQVGLEVGQFLNQRAAGVEQLVHEAVNLGGPAQRPASVGVGVAHDLGHPNHVGVIAVRRLAPEVEVGARLLAREELEHEKEEPECEHHHPPHPDRECFRRHVVPFFFETLGLVVLAHPLPALGFDLLHLAEAGHEAVGRLPVVVDPVL